MQLSCYIIDDEAHALDLLEDHIRKTPGLELLGRATNPVLGLQAVLAGPAPDVVFLDIDMPELSGLELAGLIGQRTRVIFTTAHRAYGPEAFDRDAADYLVKPIFYPRFLRALEKVKRLLAPDTGSTLFVKTGVKGQAVGILPTEILYAKAALNYLEIFTAEKRIVTYLTLGELLEKLPGGQFSRIHKSHLVSHDAIQTLEYGRVKLKDGTVLPVGRLYRADFRKKMSTLVVTSKRDHPA